MQRLIQRMISGALLSSVSLGVLAAVDVEQKVPLIAPKIVEVSELHQCFDESENSSCAEIKLQAEITGLAWLDQQLLAKLHLTEVSDVMELDAHIKLLQQQSTDWLKSSIDDIAEVRGEDASAFIAYEHSDSLRFIAQRYHLASFKQFSYMYSGGAHGMHGTRYFLYDLKDKKQLLLADILEDSVHYTLVGMLREVYRYEYPDYAQSWIGNSVEEQAEVLLTDNFFFHEHGITFSYPPYVLGPYAEGEIQLALDFGQLNGVLKSEYLFGF
ncbi:DUF3298 domain-containing protein [Denitrificimonas sp. JX-1]|uniref:DUF3298 domain-containing protein n=1 Tax=Denitrificimonas halotolerans TaxID=3098930 RepID=A0ABU5GN72_9GAMM|nr:DUF3298 domain-containing protein [Denitrificimonas sp. JX-1]MDY7218405.1 DUF3298 domain-containing protein [Denitrificimonas sp. JX-1]